MLLYTTGGTGERNEHRNAILQKAVAGVHTFLETPLQDRFVKKGQ